jgi:hypothetical protein
MALDLTGISNENEYYTHHYLSAILEQDLKGLFEKWANKKEKEGIDPPNSKLLALNREFFTIRGRLERMKSPADILKYQERFTPQLLDALGYEYRRQDIELDSGMFIPVVSEIKRSTGEPLLWILEAISPIAESEDPLFINFQDCQYGAVAKDTMVLDEDISEIVTRQIFAQTEPPRWVIVISYDSIVLLDRTKWNEKRLLRFNLQEVLSRKEPSTLKAVAALLHRESVCPAEGSSLLDTLGENSHKHAFSVSEDLKYSAREAVELLGNEAVWYLKTIRKEGVFDSALDSEQLTIECLRYLYRLLFLFYVEARPELQYVPMKSDEYRLGYSLESLRDLELINLSSEESKNGFYIHESLKILFAKVFEGFNHAKYIQADLEAPEAPLTHTFVLHPLNSHLFDPEKTQLLNKVKFRNETMQKVIELLSLSRPQGNNRRRGRISYAQLGINQLGAVYEGLLSYSGFFAQEDLYEVKKADAVYNELDTAYFVKAEDLPKYNENEKVFNSDGTLKKYSKGTFIYRLSGRTREKSASYYTPEVLTQCLVKYALKELLKNKTADQILKLKVCEMALGSGAFANEAINQIAEAYLQLKQRELGKTIGHDEYAKEKQKVKMYIADNNVFGVDLNPVAVELAEISLWLNTIYEGAQIPWFGMQLVTGNSLVGARRQVFDSSLLMKRNRGDQTWLDCVPNRVKLSEQRTDKTVYHFLLPDNGMADYNDKVVKELATEQIERIKAWRKQFIKPFAEGEVQTLERLSKAVDKLWSKHAEMQKKIRQRTTDLFPVFGQTFEPSKQTTTTHQKDDIFRQEFLSENVRSSSPYRRLKMVMDYWCALWFWPIEEAKLLPSRDEFLLELTALLEGSVYEPSQAAGDQMPLFATTASVAEQKEMLDELGYVNVDSLCKSFPRLNLVAELSKKYHYHHWELEFADVFMENDGFDLLVGNPPWIKVTWQKENILGEFEPIIIVKSLTAPEVESKAKDILCNNERMAAFYDDFVQQTGTRNFLGTASNYPILKGLQTNLYKCFLTMSWTLGNNNAITGLVHEAEVLSESTGSLKREIYRRLYAFWHFQNELPLFGEVLHTKKFACTLTASRPKEKIEFYLIANLFHPKTIDECFINSGIGKTPGIKTLDNKWETKGHRRRIILMNEKNIELLHSLFEENEVNVLDTRMQFIHSSEILEVLKTLTSTPTRFGTIKYIQREMFHETNAQNNGAIIHSIGYPKSINEVILSGPHIYTCNPFYQEAPEDYKNPQDFVPIDLSLTGESFFPRTVYKPGPKLSSLPEDIATFRNARRKMVYPMAERSLSTAIIPPEVKHINGIISMSFENKSDLIRFTGLSNSILYDFFIKLTNKTNITEDVIGILPYKKELDWRISSRVLRLNCLTKEYSSLWKEYFDERYRTDAFTKSDIRLKEWSDLNEEWSIHSSLRTPYERRQALIELDVLVALTFEISLNELITIYNVQFPILNKNERGTWYDQNGRIVHSVSSTYSAINKREIFDRWDGISTASIDEFVPPFAVCNREEDYAIAWKEFEKRMK